MADALWQSLINTLAQGGPATILCLLAIIVALTRQWIVPGWLYRERVSELRAALAAKDATVAEREKQIAILLGGVRESAQ